MVNKRPSEVHLALLLAVPALLLSIIASMAYPDGWASFAVGAGYSMAFSIPALSFSSRRVRKERATSLLTRRVARHERNLWGHFLYWELSGLVGAIAATAWDLIATSGVVVGALVTLLVWAAADPVATDAGVGAPQRAGSRRPPPGRDVVLVRYGSTSIR